MYIKRLLAATLLLGLIGLGIFAHSIYTTIFSPNTKFDEPTHFVFIKTGGTYSDVLQQLKPLLKDLGDFNEVAQKKKYTNHVKAGRYIIRKGMNNNEIVNTLRSKNKPFPLIFNNQERLENLAARIAKQIEPDSISLLKAMRDSTFLAENDFDEANALSMYIPNKYQFFWNTSVDEFRKRMLKEYHRFWNEQRLEKAEKEGLTPKKVIVLASIVQKETAKVDERKRVAGVYINRFRKGMKLDADPTVIYALKKQRKNFDTIIKRVLYKDLEIESPYNTYLHRELPPGPITMPDISAIDAVLNYEKHDFFYFVADVDRPGYHKFSKTLRAHNRNRQEYVRWVNKMGINR